MRSAGQAFGDFQMMLSEFRRQLSCTTPFADFHDTRKRYAKLKEDAAADPCGRVSEVRAELDWLLSVEDEACKLTDMHDAGELPLQGDAQRHEDQQRAVRRGDLKARWWSIDLDTVMPGLVGHDFGDAIRFAANFVEEDCPEADRAGLNLNIYWAFAEGLPEGDRARADGGGGGRRWATSCFTLACELATRFLDDYITGRQVLQDPFSTAQSGAHPLPDRAGEGYAEEDERHERHRAGLLDEVQGEVKIQAGG